MIAEIEDAIIARVKSVLGDRVKTVESLPASLDEAELQRRLRSAPGVYVTFLGGAARDENELVLDADFGVFFLVAGLREDERRRGIETASTRKGAVPKGGAYTLLVATLPRLQGMRIEGCGSLSCREVNNLFSDEVDRAGVSLYSASFRVPMPVRLLNADELEDFLELNAQYVLAPHAMPPRHTPLPYAGADAGDDIALPQGDEEVPYPPLPRWTAGANPYVVTGPYVVLVQGATAQVVLPQNRWFGMRVVVKDATGVALANGLKVVTTDGSQIDGKPSFPFDANYQSAEFIWNNVQWSAL